MSAGAFYARREAMPRSDHSLMRQSVRLAIAEKPSGVPRACPLMA